MMIDDDLSFGALLRRYRLTAGLTQASLAERAGLSQRAVNDLERDPKRSPRLETAAMLADALALAPLQRTRLIAAAHPRETVTSPVSLTPDPSPIPLVGRGRELALLERHLRCDGPPILVLSGEPGIGKTRLLHETMHRASALGWQVLHGGCQRRGGQEPYAPLLDALAIAIQRLAPLRRPSALRGCAWLMRLLPELAALGPEVESSERLPTWALSAEQERHLIFQAVIRLLVNIAGTRGTMLVLDDLQWAGSDALDLLMTLAHATSIGAATDTPALRIVGAYRNTETHSGDLLSDMLADLAHARLVTHHTLAPLAPHETKALLDALLLPEPSGDHHMMSSEQAVLTDRLVQRTGGVPFFIVSCAQSIAPTERQGSTPHERVGASSERAMRQADEIPWTVRQSVQQRIARLPAETRALLNVAAVIGRVVPVELLATVVEQPAMHVLDAIETACNAHLLEDDGVAGVRFSHDLIREVVEADIGSARRALLHRQVAEALERQATPAVEVVAYHYARSGLPEQTIHYLEQAADHALAQRALAAAECYYRDLVACLDGLGRPLDAARAREKWGAVLSMATRYAAALAVLEHAAEAYQAAGDRESVGRAVARIGRVYVTMGTGEAGLLRLRPVVDALDRGTPFQGLADLYVTLAALYGASGRYADDLTAADRALALAQAVGDERIEVAATYERGFALLELGRIEEARAVLARAVSRAEVEGPLDVLCWSLNGLTILHVYAGDFETAKLYSTRALDIAQRHGDPAQTAFMTQNAHLPIFLMGDWQTARRGFEQSVAMTRTIERFFGPAYALNKLGWVALQEGRWDDAARALDESIAIATRINDVEALRKAQPLRAELDILRGDPETAHARLINLRDAPGQEEFDVTGLLPTLAWAYLEMGHVAAARAVAARAVRRGRAQHYRLALLNALRIQALVAIRQGHWSQAERALAEGLTLAQRMCYPYGEARLLFLFGELHTRRGRPEQARTALQAALLLFERLGARKDTEQVTHALTTLAVATNEDIQGEIVSCPHCQSAAYLVKAGRNASGSQRYLCTHCGRKHTPQPAARGYPTYLREQALHLYTGGRKRRRIGRELGVSHQTVTNWLVAMSPTAQPRTALTVERPATAAATKPPGTAG